MLHTSAWYHADQRLGPVSPSCPESPDSRDGTHCAAAWGYGPDSNGLPYWMGKSYINSLCRLASDMTNAPNRKPPLTCLCRMV